MSDLPEAPYPPAVLDAKVRAVYNHVVGAYRDDGSSVYAMRALPTGGSAAVVSGLPLDVERISDAVVERIRTDPQFAARVAAELGAPGSN